MADRAGPVLIAYDGSDLSKAAVRRAAELFPERPAVLATVWEPGLAAIPVGPPGTLGIDTVPPDPETVETVDRIQRDHATKLAAEGAELATSLGLAAEPHAVQDELDVADTLIEIARDRGAAVIVLGTHGISGLRSHLLGGVSRKVVSHGDRPVLVVPSEKD